MNEMTRVEIHPSDRALRRSASWSGISLEIAQFIGNDRFDYKFEGPVHLIAVCERAIRRAGETRIGNHLRSVRRDFGGTLSVVPAGDEFHGTFVPHVSPRNAYLYLDPRLLLADSEIGLTARCPRPRLFFENRTLWVTARKLSAIIENPGMADGLYAETLARVLLLELLRLEHGNPGIRETARGGLAAWQERRACDFIQDHLAADVSLTDLARLTSLSTTHFCRAFKRSVGLPPHRYQLERRIERAKTLLADPTASVTAVASACGFKDSGSFATAFRKATGLTPSAFRRMLQ